MKAPGLQTFLQKHFLINNNNNKLEISISLFPDVIKGALEKISCQIKLTVLNGLKMKKKKQKKKPKKKPSI